MNKVSKDLDVMIIGAAIVDLPLRPVSKEVFDVVSYPVDGIAMTIGGDALNESTIITRLGHKVALMSCIGVDVAGAFVLSNFNNPLFDNKALVSVFSKAKEEGMIICADMVSPRLNEKLEDITEALSYVDYFFPNFEEASEMTGETDEAKVADKLYACGVKNVIMKIGKRGCYIRNADGAMIVPACKGVTAIDTIGAGDNFASGFITGLLEGKDIRECAIYANCTAAVSVQYVGATGGVTDKAIVDKMLAKYREDYK